MFFIGLTVLSLPVILIAVLVSHGRRISIIEKELKLGANTSLEKSSGNVASTVVPNTSGTINMVRTSPASTSQPINPVSASPVSNSVSPGAQSRAESVQSRGSEPNRSLSTDTKSEDSSGKILGGIGIGAVVIGISFFLKYAFDNNWIGPTGRVILGIIAGLFLLALGQFLRKKYVGYSDFLMGGGIAVLYLAIFAAYNFYQLIPSGLAGVIMLGITALGLVISIVNGTIAIALVSTIGGLLVPQLIPTQTDNMATLFVYLIILNLGVLAVSFFKKWPLLILISLVGTILNFSAWFAQYYRQELLGPTLVFSFIIFFIFLIASIAKALIGRSVADQLNYLIIGGNAFSFAITGYIILKPQHDDLLGFASVFVAIVFMVVAFIVNKFNPEDKGMNIFLPGLAVTFLSIAVPMQLSGPWIAVAWLVEAIFLYVIASFIGNRDFQVMGVVVYFLGLINAFFWNYPSAYRGDFAVIFNSHFVVMVIAIICAYIIAYIYHRYGSTSVDIQKRGIMVFILVANILTIYAVSSQIVFHHQARQYVLNQEYNMQTSDAQKYNTDYYFGDQYRLSNNEYSKNRESIQNRSNTYVSIFWTIYAAILTAVGFGMRIPTARRLGLILFLVTAFKVVSDVWSLGQLYRIISFTVFGIVALVASFAYAKYKDRLKEIV